jgi:hypothetical protein
MLRRYILSSVAIVCFLSIASIASVSGTSAVNTYVSGTITTTTWTASLSPYYVTGTITVSTGDTLTIDPGVDVLFDADAQFIVEGVLNAVGTETDSIRFIKGAAVQWGGLRISGGNVNTFAYTRISDANAGAAVNGGGIYVSGGQLLMDNSVLSGNIAGDGGALYNVATTTLTNCTIAGNTASSDGGGIQNNYNDLTLTDCVIKGNNAGDWGAGLRNHTGTATLTRCIIAGNSTVTYGGGFYNNDGSVTLENCTLYGNSAALSGGALGQHNATSTFKNSILWNNTIGEMYVQSGTVTATYSDILGGYAGVGNISLNPLFVNAVAGDYSLQFGSPCIDSGDPASPLDTYGTRADMGAVPHDQTGYVSGPITTSTWTLAESPYYIAGQCTVATGNVLTIEPGVEVKAKVDAALIVLGSLSAVGAPGDSIRFGLDTGYTQWGGLHFYGGDSSTVHYTVITGALGMAGGSTKPSARVRRDRNSDSERPAKLDRESHQATRDALRQEREARREEAERQAKPAYTSGPYSGGAITVAEAGTQVDIAHSALRDNAGQYGGCISVYATAHVNVSDCDLTNDHSSNNSYGGAVYMTSSATGTFTSCDISNNYADYEGGAVHMTGSADADFIDCNISDNEGYYNGGGVYISDATASFSGCVINNNYADEYGGAVYIDYATASFDGCTIDYNEAYTYNGGGVRLEYGTADFTDCSIRGNYADEYGGGVYSYEGIATFNECKIDSNNTYYYYGAGIYGENGTLDFTDCSISENIAEGDEGGGAYLNTVASTFTNCTINDNYTTSYGGGLDIYNGTTVLTNCIIAGNIAGSEGGGISVDGGPVTLTNCTIADNQGSNGGAVSTYGAAGIVTMKNTISWNNSPNELYLWGLDGSFVVTYSDVQDTVNPGASIFSANPMFRDAANRDYSLFYTSPCKDAGDPLSPLDADETAADVGAIYHDQIRNTYGPITTTTWTIAKSPYYIVDHCTVPTGNTLTIEPGVRVEARKDVAITIEGSLQAIGTEGDTIRFGPNETQQQWGGLRFYGGGASNIQYAEITGVYTEQPQAVKLSAETHRDSRSDADRRVKGGNNVPGDRVAKPAYYTSAHIGGAVVVVDAGTSLDLANSTIHGNHGRYGGGISIHDGANVTASDCNVKLNDAYWYGGGLYMTNGSTGAFTNCDFNSNTATFGAGVTVLGTSTANFTDCGISYSTADENGGGAYIESAQVDFIGCTISNNYVNFYYGGGLYMERSDVTFTTCTISGNTSAGYEGGGCAIYAGTTVFDDCIISGNSTSDDGGGIYADAYSSIPSTVTLTGCAISSNSASYAGGGIEASDTHLTMIDCDIKLNTSVYDAAGVDIYGTGVTGTFTNCRFENNSGGDGGGMWTNVPTTLDHCLFAGNSSVQPNSNSYGGGIYIGGGPLVMTNCTVYDNLAQPYIGGGGDSEVYKPAQFTGLGGGIWISMSDNVDIENSILWNNTPENIADAGRGHTLSVSHSDIGLPWPVAFTGPGNLNVDPMVKTDAPPDSMYHLIVGSPCVNTGNPSSPRDPDGTVTDMGAFPRDFTSELELSLPTQSIPRNGDAIVQIWGSVQDALSAEFAFIVDASIVDTASSFIRSTAFDGNPAVSFTHNMSGDTVRVALSSSEPVSLIDSTLVEMAFAMSVEAFYDTTTFTWLSYPETMVNELATLLTVGELHVHPRWGDASDNGQVSAFDASLILQASVNKPVSLLELCADVTDNGYVTAYDAAQVLKRVVDPAFVFPVEQNTQVKPMRTVAPELVWTPTDNGWALVADDPTGILSGDLVIQLQNDVPVGVQAEGLAEYRQTGRTLNVAFARLESSVVELFQIDVAGGAPTVLSGQMNEGIALDPRSIRPLEMSLGQNYPNPFNPATTIRYSVAEGADVSVLVYDVLGQQVRTLVAEHRAAGRHTVVWDGHDDSGRSVASGVYVIRMKAGDFVGNNRVMLIR